MSTVTPDSATLSAAPTLATDDRGLSITSLVLGLVSIAAGWTIVAPIAGLVLGILALRREPAGRSFAVWGIVLNSVVLAGTAIIAVLGVVFGLALLPFAFLGN